MQGDLGQEEIKLHLKKELLKIEKTLEAERISQIEFINQVSEYVLFSGGKRIRPLLFILCAKACGINSQEDLYRSSLLFEYLHTATLLHDDVVDSAEFRRGRKAARNLWGNQATILVGDYLYAKALRLASELSSSEFMDLITYTTLLMSKGEILQLLYFAKFEMTEEEYYEVIFRKTAALISACCEGGAIIAKAPFSFREALKEYGTAIGYAFQIVDDILDYQSEKTGKDLGRDFSEGKITLPVILAIQKASEEEKKELLSLLTMEGPKENEFFRARKLIDRLGGFSLAQRKAEEFLQRAINSLEVLPSSLAKNSLLYLAHYIINRSH